MAYLYVAALSALAAAVSGEGYTYVWNQNNKWSTSSNWATDNWDGLVDLSQDCVNSFNVEETAGMAIGLDMDATAGTIRMPANGRIVFGEKANGEIATLTLTGSSNTPTNNWNCRERLALSSACPSNYKVFNSTGEIATDKPPCWEDTVVLDLDVVSAMQWHPGQIIKELKVTRGYQSPAAEGTVLATWPAPATTDSLGMSYADWHATIPSRISGPAPGISSCPNSGCQIYCFNACPAADITDLDLSTSFGTILDQDDMDAALDSAIQARAAIGRMRNELRDVLNDPGDYRFEVGYVLDDLLVQYDVNVTAAELLERVRGEDPWVQGIFMGWSVEEREGLTLIVRAGMSTNLDYNIAWEQAKYGLKYIAGLDGPVTTPIPVTPMILEPIFATSSAAADMLTGDVNNIPSTAVGGLAGEFMRWRIRHYLTNDRAQVTARYYQNATNDVVVESTWMATDTFRMNSSAGTLLSAQAVSRRTAANPEGEDGSRMIARVIDAANKLTGSAGGETSAAIQDIGALKCGSFHAVDSSDRFARGACVATGVFLAASTVYVTVDGNDVSLISPSVFEATLGLVITQMSMHAVGASLNESIVRTDAAWAAFTAPSASDDEDDGFFMGFSLMIVAAAGGGLVLCLLIIIVIMVRGGDGEGGGNKGGGGKSDRNVVAFENPMYDDPASGSVEDAEDGGLYDEPAFKDGKENPTYDSGENIADDAGAGGYLDVEPDNGDEDDEDDDSESGSDDDDDDDE